MSATDDAWRWLEQARIDLDAARSNKTRHPYVACFLAHQAAEKALKAALLARSGMVARTHSLSRLEQMLQDMGVVLQGVRHRALRDLERLHGEARYPDALPDDIPGRYFREEDAEEAISIAASVLSAVERIF
ncbi:MAG: HEPN domain-containing protein [Clostridiales bacterium]|nr:HEPN domain-containing protein [Clostridiales bacterium]